MEQVSIQEHIPQIPGIVRMVFETMLGIPAEPTASDGKTRDAPVTAAIFFAGAWSGAVLMETSLEDALSITEALGEGGRPSALDDTVRDVLGELANTIAGNFKAFLPRGTGISMPTVVQGSDYVIWFRGGTSLGSMTFDSPLGAFCLHLFETKSHSNGAGRSRTH